MLLLYADYKEGALYEEKRLFRASVFPSCGAQREEHRPNLCVLLKTLSHSLPTLFLD